MNKTAVVQKILNEHVKTSENKTVRKEGSFFAPSNIALCKYWGKRNGILNLPVTGSLSISLGNFGANTKISLLEDGVADEAFVNDSKINLTPYLDLFRPTPTTFFRVESTMNLPMGAGLASSACGYAALIGALDKLFGWHMPLDMLSVLARLGSGSACRSFWQGFVEWQVGNLDDGMDSIGVPLSATWPDLRIGLLILNSSQKSISSREAMKITRETSPFYTAWPQKHAADFLQIKSAILEHDFVKLGEASESNALAMHAMMLAANPPILYSESKTISAMHAIWRCRQDGLSLYFTQDAGPNLKLLFLEKDLEDIKKQFPELLIIAPFENRISK